MHLILDWYIPFKEPSCELMPICCVHRVFHGSSRRLITDDRQPISGSISASWVESTCGTPRAECTGMLRTRPLSVTFCGPSTVTGCIHCTARRGKGQTVQQETTGNQLPRHCSIESVPILSLPKGVVASAGRMCVWDLRGWCSGPVLVTEMQKRHLQGCLSCRGGSETWTSGL